LTGVPSPQYPSPVSRQGRRWLWLAVALAVVAVVATPRFFVATRFETPRVEFGQQADTLVVVMHGLSGSRSLDGLATIVREAYPGADLLAPRFLSTPLSNVDPYQVADTVETVIDTAYRDRRYTRIVLVGHSMGAVLLRKVVVWAHGFEEDRPAPRGEREWPSKVERFVSLAGINRGWSIDPAPVKMSWPKYLLILVAEKFARLTDTGTLVRHVQRGAPFVADLRVQWIRAARQGDDGPVGRRRVAGPLPFVVHLVGSIDDIITGEDSRDVAAAKDVKFVTIPNVGHGEIAEAFRKGLDRSTPLARHVYAALKDPPDQIRADTESPLTEKPKVTRIVYIMHGIRDYADWSDHIRSALKSRLPDETRETVAVVPAKYGYFAMLPFLFAWDRQRNVRWFMDEFTDNFAEFPSVRVFDYVGHSNGTYILASALQRYRTLRVRHVLFMGSVVPKHYPWRPLLDARRVTEVTNVVAAGDWVVALFPRLFEQFAEWGHRRPATGLFDIGSSGFHGFEASQLADGRVENVEYVAGGHGAGVDVDAKDRLKAIVEYLATDQRDHLKAFRETRVQPAWLSVLSNVSWVVWLVLASLVVGLGMGLDRLGGERIVHIGSRPFRRGRVVLLGYVLVVLALLYSV
jgi:pimeloyl-ACP methyl ester carboxylesterase